MPLGRLHEVLVTEEKGKQQYKLLQQVYVISAVMAPCNGTVD